MEFKEFCKERDRMFQYHSGKCKDNACPLFNVKNNNRFHRCDYGSFLEPEKAEKAVFEWSKEHPVMTNADKFMEVFGTEFNDAMSEIGMWHWQSQEYKPPRKGSENES